MYKLKAHHIKLLERLGIHQPPAPHSPYLTAEMNMMLGVVATDINYGASHMAGSVARSGPPRKVMALHHRVRIMEPGSSRVHFIDCEVPV